MLHRHLRTHQIFGAGTNVGKTLLTTALCRASLLAGERTAYLKPVGTGGALLGDDGHVKTYAGKGVATRCLFSFDEPVSPHLAAQRAAALSKGKSHKGKQVPNVPSDDHFISQIAEYVQAASEVGASHPGALYVESAGGVHSPTLSGTSQLVAYRPLRLPTLLVACPHLGGISSTISAYESLLLHGYSVDALMILKESRYENYAYLKRWGEERGLRVTVVDSPPERQAGKDAERKSMETYYANLTSPEPTLPIPSLLAHLQRTHARRVDELESLPRRALDQVWWPFVQHGNVRKESDVLVVDSALGDYFAAHRKPTTTPAAADVDPSTSLLTQTFDGSASWWTQTLGHSSPTLALAAASAAGRYGHVLFPNAAHAPAVELTERLLQSVGRGWASRVFFSDDGSTGVEVALKMALSSFTRRFSEEGGWKKRKHLGVLGLKGSYHGDTIGAMDASEGSVFNAQVDWYTGKGFWLDPPTVQIRDGGIAVIEAEGLQWATSMSDPQVYLNAFWQSTFEAGFEAVYDVDTRLRKDPLAAKYRRHLEITLDEAVKVSEFTLAALVLEPVVMGAGGMKFVDPLFQRVLVDLVREQPERWVPPGASTSTSPVGGGGGPKNPTAGKDWQGLPIIFDEVFTGLHRLGRSSGASFLGTATPIHPDIAVYAKILTAGTVPMSVTLATDATFQAFRGNTKMQALLHGHSYTAHPIGCAVANAGLDALEKLERQGAWEAARKGWSTTTTVKGTDVKSGGLANAASAIGPWSLWNKQFVERLTTFPGVDGAMALGTVLAIYLRDVSDSGYASAAAAKLTDAFQDASPIAPASTAATPAGLPFQIHARPLGNVAYFMTSLTTTRATLAEIEKAITRALEP